MKCHYKGKLRQVAKLPNEIFEEQCERLSKKHGYFDLPEDYVSWKEVLCNHLYDEYIIAWDELIYEIIDKEEIEYKEKFYGYQNEDGIIDYEVIYDDYMMDFNYAMECMLEDL